MFWFRFQNDIGTFVLSFLTLLLQRDPRKEGWERALRGCHRKALERDDGRAAPRGYHREA